MRSSKFYSPMTATPFQRSSYREILPVSALRDSVRCFWGSDAALEGTHAVTPTLVIPDTCADILYWIDETSGTITRGFCGVSDHSTMSHPPAGEGS